MEKPEEIDEGFGRSRWSTWLCGENRRACVGGISRHPDGEIGEMITPPADAEMPFGGA